MLALSNVFHFLAHKLARLSRRRFAFPLIFPRPFYCFFFWHNKIVSPVRPRADVTKPPFIYVAVAATATD
jgi:hypothetical protein